MGWKCQAFAQIFFGVVEGKNGCITTLVAGIVYTIAVVDPCDSNPCYNQGTCVSFGTGEGGGRKRRQFFGGLGLGGLSGQAGYYGYGGGGGPIGGSGGQGGAIFFCFCRPGFTGSYCQFVDPCDSNPCYNQGTCVSFGTGEGGGRKRRQWFGGLGLGGLSGQAGYYGYGGGGGPIGGSGGQGGAIFFCFCRPGFTGSYCQFVDPCDSNPCYNQGTCVSFGTGEGGGRKRRQWFGGLGLGGLSGQAGYYGYGGGGGPIGGSGGQGGAIFFCFCRPGFTGRYCQLTDPCVPNPCENGGFCSETLGNYTCFCAPNYTGTNCETSSGGINCNPPCNQNEICTDTASGIGVCTPTQS